MTDSNEAAEQPDEWQEPAPELVEELLQNPDELVRMIRKHPESLQYLEAGYRAARDGFSELLTATDRGATRYQATANKVLDSIRKELDREGLTPEERMNLFQMEERVLREVRENEKDVQEAGERSFAKLVTIGATVAVSVVALGFLVKQGKLPPINLPTV